MKIKSTFNNNDRIPSKYSCSGYNINPLLEIIDPPKDTKSFALIMDDPDAPVGLWVHWLLWNISKDTRVIKENSIPEGAIQGTNSSKKLNYQGPCPPRGIHRYFFKIYALNTNLDLKSTSTKQDLEKAMKGHILEKAELIGLFEKE